MPSPPVLPAWSGFDLHVRPTHLEHLLRPLGWSTWTADALLTRIHATQALSAQHQLALALGAPGPYDLITFPDEEHFDLALTVHRQSGETFTLDTAATLCPLVGGLDFAPHEARALLSAYRTIVDLAHDVGQPIATRWHGLCDLLISGDGRWVAYGRHSLSCPRFLHARPV